MTRSHNRTLEVVGSIPIGSTNSILFLKYLRDAASSLEPTPERTGSLPEAVT